MGQQQLLLLVLSIVVVSIAVYIGIDMFGKSAQQNHMDSLVGYAVDVASDAIQWREKQSPYLGGGGSFLELNPGTEDLERFLISTNRPPGVLAVDERTENTLVLVGISSSYPEIGVRLRVERFDIVSTEVYQNNEICEGGGAGAVSICPGS